MDVARRFLELRSTYAMYTHIGVCIPLRYTYKVYLNTLQVKIPPIPFSRELFVFKRRFAHMHVFLSVAEVVLISSGSEEMLPSDIESVNPVKFLQPFVNPY